MRLQQLARDLWPYLQPLIEPMLRRTSSASSGGGVVGGAPSPHALNSTTHHSGTLADSQAPQFLMRDGSRSLVGNLAVATGVTVDGVDLSAHAADPAAHHALATAGNTGINVTGQAISLFLNATASGLEISSGLRLADSIAGSGLIIASKILAVGAGDGIDVNANDVAVDVTDIIDTAAGLQEDASNNIQIKRDTDSGLAFALAGGLKLGTPSTIGPNSTNNVTGVNHGHAADASSDVGTTPAEKLLKSTPSGGLTLANLSVRGNVDIVNGGDLTVGSNVLFVDVSLASVGINRAPDPQFALDVNGPIRGTEIVGKHAIQLDDVALLCHFDGGTPYASNYTGEPNGIPLGQVPGLNQNVHYRPGNFYKAAVFGVSRTNLATNPSFETGTSGWTIFNDPGGDMAASQDTTVAWYGAASAKLTWTAINNSQFYHSPVASSSAADYTFGVWLKAAIPTTVTIRIARDSSPFTQYAAKSVNATEDWQFFSLTATSPGTVPLRVNISPQGSANTLWVDGVQLEQASQASWYIDGSLGTGYAWTGTAHASTSTRTNARMLYGLNNMVKHRWTVMGWFQWPAQLFSYNSNSMYVQLGSHSFNLYVNNTGIWSQVVHSGGTNFVSLLNGGPTPATWYHFAVTYTPGSLSFYINGVLITSRAYTFGTEPQTAGLGFVSGPAYGDPMIDDFVVSRQALNANMIRAIYESDAPVFAESSVFSFRATPKGLVWADEEGLWMRDANGDPVLGAYGGAATKSWAGLTLSPADVVLGDSNRGAYMLWDDSAGTLILGKTGASTSNLYLDGGAVKLRANATERFSLSSAGVMEIKDSGGNAVFTFNASAGAEFTKPLTLGSAGGIYQGTGSFASPTTGLKIWNDSGVGRIAGYNASAAQWYADTDGKLYAGGGNLVIDASGAYFPSTAGTSVPSVIADLPNAKSLRWLASGNVLGGITSGYFSAAGENTMMIMEGAAGSATTAAVELRALNDSNSVANLRVSSQPGQRVLEVNVDFSSFLGDVEVTGNFSVLGSGNIISFPTTGRISGGRAQFSQPSTTAAVPALYLEQDDLSEEFIELSTTVGAGNPVDTAALGAYYGKMRVSVNGTFKYIPLYS